jgi:hypothetical protein
VRRRSEEQRKEDCRQADKVGIWLTLHRVFPRLLRNAEAEPGHAHVAPRLYVGRRWVTTVGTMAFSLSASIWRCMLRRVVEVSIGPRVQLNGRDVSV